MWGDRDLTFCPYCGSQVDADSLFCKRCGKRIDEGEKVGITSRDVVISDVKCDCGRVTPHLHYSQLHDKAILASFVLFVLLETSAFVEGRVKGSTQLYLRTYEIEAYKYVANRIEELTSPYNGIYYGTFVLECVIFALLVAALATRYSTRYMRLHKIAAIFSPIIHIGEMATLVLLASLIAQAVSRLAQTVSGSTLETAMSIQRRFDEAYGFWASPTYAAVRSVMNIATLLLLFVVAFTSRKPTLWPPFRDQAAILTTAVTPVSTPQRAREREVALPEEVARTQLGLRRIALFFLVTGVLLSSVFYVTSRIPIMPVSRFEYRTDTATFTQSMIVPTHTRWIETVATTVTSRTTHRDDESVMLTTIRSTITRSSQIQVTMWSTETTTSIHSSEVTRHLSFSQAYPLLWLIAFLTFASVSTLFIVKIFTR
jgi:hypothetical protein